jgi:hypothetical protein
MHSKILIIFILIFLKYGSIHANEKFNNMLTISPSIWNKNISEKKTSISSELDDNQPQSLDVNGLSLDLMYEFNVKSNSSYFTRLSIPITISENSFLTNGSMGYNIYFRGLPSSKVMQENSISYKIIPQNSFYLGFGLGFEYLVYSTTLAQKSDISLNIEVQTGLIYRFKNDWIFRPEIQIVRSTGIITDSIAGKVSIGLIYEFE